MARIRKNSTQNKDTCQVGVIYARYSSSGQRDESIEGQLRDCHAFAERYNIRIIEEYCDRAMTGTSDRRPEFQRMIRDSSKGQFNVVITWKNDRFARSRYDSAVYKAKLKQNGVRLLYAKESIPDGPEGIVLESVMEGFAEYYSANLSQNVKRGNYDSALKRQTLGQTVFGLRKGADKRFEIDPLTGPVVQRIFREYAAGQSAVSIYTALNVEGFRTLRGNPFNKNSIRKILQNEKYVGVYEYADIRDEHGIPALVSRETFDRVQIMLEKHHRSPAAKKDAGGFLLTTKLFCGECGEPMTGDCGTGKSGTVYSYYICNGRRAKKCKKERVSKEWIEDVVVAALAEVVNNDEMINSFADHFMAWQATQQPGSAISDLEQRIKQIDTAIRNTMSVIDSGLITESLKSHLLELETEKAALADALAKKRLDTVELDRDTVIWFLERFRTADMSDPGWRIYIVETFLQAVYLYDDGRLLLRLNYGGKNNEVSLKAVEETVAEGEQLSSMFEFRVPRRAKGELKRASLCFLPNGNRKNGGRDMKKKNLSKLSGGIAVAGAVALAGVYFFTREMMGAAMNRDESGFLKSSNHHRKLTPAKEAFNEARREAMEVMDGLPMEEVTLTAADGTRLVGHWYPCPEEKRVILAMHGWRSSWEKDFCLITPFLHKNGCSILFAEQRGQNGSGGEYMSFGLMERYDCLTWARWLAEKCPQRPIYLSGVSMGATTVLMASNLDLPKQVHGIIADCGYTSPYEIWKHVVNGKIHLPYVLRGKMSDTMFLRRVKAGSSRYSAQDALAMTKLPVLFVHCTEDRFVPVKMTYQNYKSCAGPKRLLIVPGGDHSMSYFLEKDKYEKELKSLWADYDE